MNKFVDLTSNNAIQNIIETFNVSDEIGKERYEEIEKKLKNKISHDGQKNKKVRNIQCPNGQN